MPVRTKRWNDPALPDDGFRLLVCRIRPRGVAKQAEPWHDWWPDLGPSRGLLDDFHGKGSGEPYKSGSPLAWGEYAPRYLDEMRGAAQIWRIRALARRVAEGETVTLLCSSACVDASRCHRTLLARLIDLRAPDELPGLGGARPLR